MITETHISYGIRKMGSKSQNIKYIELFNVSGHYGPAGLVQCKHGAPSPRGAN